MSDFGDRFATQAVPGMFGHLGDEVTYRAVGGSTKTINALYERMLGTRDEKQEARFTIRDDATLGVAAPERGDRITFDGRTYSVVDVSTDGCGTHEIYALTPELVT